MILKLLPLGAMCWRCSYAEGLTGAEEQNVRETPLDGRCAQGARQAVIVVPCGEDTGAEAAALEALRQGTPVVFLRPSAKRLLRNSALAKSSGARRMRLISRWSADHPLWFAAVGDFLQFHGTADMYG